MKGSCGHQHFALATRFLFLAILQVTHAHGAAILDDKAGRQRFGDDGQLRIMRQRIEECPHAVAAFMRRVVYCIAPTPACFSPLKSGL